MMFGDKREQYRRVFIEAWRKHADGTPLEPLERIVVDVIDAHPEYQEMLGSPDALERDYPAGDAAANPFLHMGMHITIIEQVTSDRPPGIRALYGELRQLFGDSHDVEHAMMQCLAGSLADARDRGDFPDEQRYLECLRRLKPRVL